LETIIDEIKGLLGEVRYPEDITSAEDILRFVNLIINRLQGDRGSQSYQRLIILINKQTEVFIELFKKIHQLLIQVEEFRVLDELSYFLFRFKDDFFTHKNYEFLRFLIKEPLQMGLNANKFELVMQHYVEITSFFYPHHKPYYGDILDLKEILEDLDLLWNENYNNLKWGSCTHYIQGKEFFFDNAGAIGNLTYLRWSVRKQLNLFQNFREEFEFVMEEVRTLIMESSPLIAVFLFSEFYENVKYYNDSFNSVEKKYFSEEIPKLTLLIKENTDSSMVLSRYYRIVSLILPLYDFISKQLIYWKKFISNFFKRQDGHGKYIFTSDQMDMMTDNNKYLKELFRLLKDDPRLKKKLRKLCWDLVKFYIELGFESWAILTIIDLIDLRSKRRKKILIKNRKKIIDKTIEEYKKRSSNQGIGIEYCLSKNDLLYILDRYIVNHYILGAKGINYLEVTMNAIPEYLKVWFPSKLYIDLIIGFSIEIHNYDISLKYLNVLNEKSEEFFIQKPEIVEYRFLNSIINISQNILNGEIIDFESEKVKLDSIISLIYPTDDPFTEISKIKLNKLRDFICLYYDVLNIFLTIQNVLKNWELQINEGKNLIYPGWTDLKNNLVLHELKLEILMYSTSSKKMLGIILLLKQIFEFYKKIGLILQETLDGNIFRANLNEALFNCYKNFEKNVDNFSKILLLTGKKKDTNSFLNNISMDPIILPLKGYYGIDENPNIQIVPIKYEKIHHRFKLKYEIPKEELIQLAKYPLSFFSEVEWNFETSYNQEIKFGILWIEDVLPMYSYKRDINIFTEDGHNIVVEIYLNLKKESTREIYVIPFIENERFSKKIFGENKKLSTALYKAGSSIEPMLEISIDSVENYKRVSLLSYEFILEKILELILKGETININIFKNLSEPQIRDQFLMLLASIFAGRATGETFNKKGKTDILIKEDNYNLFICECKFWSGPKKLTETIQQLFDYKTWRDSKTAILLFNKTVKPSTVIEKINPTILAHPNCKSEYNFIRDKLRNEEIVFGYIFSHPEDKKREFHLSVIVFNII